MIGVFRFSVVIEGALEAAEGFDWDSGQVVVEMGTPMLQQMTRLFRQRPEDRPVVVTLVIGRLALKLMV